VRHLNGRVCSRISKEEVKGALRKKKSGRAIGPDLIPGDIWKCLGEKGLDWLTELLMLFLEPLRCLMN